MKQIYDFEQHTPPVLNENMLHIKLEERKKQVQVILVALGSILFQMALLFLGFLMRETYPVVILIVFCYTMIAAVGGSVIAVVYVEKGGATL